MPRTCTCDLEQGARCPEGQRLFEAARRLHFRALHDPLNTAAYRQAWAAYLAHLASRPAEPDASLSPRTVAWLCFHRWLYQRGYYADDTRAA
ncbi:MAG: hypothetical protein QJR03_06355 [Sphaerobacter sp.]|nr:hypothetical protein [Sphaerobacter sp.]